MKINLDNLTVEDLMTVEKMADRLEMPVAEFVDLYNEDDKFRDIVALMDRYDVLDTLLNSL